MNKKVLTISLIIGLSVVAITTATLTTYFVSKKKNEERVNELYKAAFEMHYNDRVNLFKEETVYDKFSICPLVSSESVSTTIWQSSLILNEPSLNTIFKFNKSALIILSSSISTIFSPAITTIWEACSMEISSKLPLNKESPSLIMRFALYLFLTSFVRNRDFNSS